MKTLQSKMKKMMMKMMMKKKPVVITMTKVQVIVKNSKAFVFVAASR